MRINRLEGMVITMNYLLICRSVTYAQRTARTLESSGISAVIMRTPKELSLEGCSYGVRISSRRIAEALVAVRNAGLPSVRVFTQGANGLYGEVGL